jgi:type I restriction enzyme M protein
MPIKKSALYSSLWKSCDELRGGMDASQYKDYVLVLLFVKYVSDKYAGRKDGLLDVPKGGGFADMVALKGDKEIGDKVNKIVARLAAANDLRGVIDVADFNDADKLGKGKDMVDRLSNLVAIFDTPALDFRGNRAEGDDLLGDAYEYLMRHFATESGKSKGQFYTPAEVSRVMAKVIGLGAARRADQSIHDPTCGSGSLLLKAHDEARHATGLDLALYGQEMDNATAALARMNMILHDCPTAEIWQDNTLSSPHFLAADGRLKAFDFVVANFPFSNKSWSNGLDPANDDYGRFALGVPPAKNGDYAFLLHILATLKANGKGAVIHPHGVLFRGNAEADIRREIVRRGYIKGIIGLPANLFYGTGIPACILVLDKEHAHARKGIFMVDASKGFIKDGNKNRLREQDLHRIVDTFNRQVEVPRYARMVTLAEISDPRNDFNLNLPRYIDGSEPEDLHDIDAHLRGGIPERDLDALDAYWQVLPSLRSALFQPLRPGYSASRKPQSEIKPAIFGHPEFTAYQASVAALFAKWRKANAPRLRAVKPGDAPKALVETLSEDLLRTFQTARLIDPYDVYQHLMDYWAEGMQDDVYLLVADGWKAVVDGKPNTDLVPERLVAARFLAHEQADVERLEAGRDAVTRQVEELDEEHGGEDGLLSEAKTDKGKLTKASVAARLREVGPMEGEWDVGDEGDGGDACGARRGRAGRRTSSVASVAFVPLVPFSSADTEPALLRQYLELLDREAEASRKVKESRRKLDAAVAATYAGLTTDEVKALVVDDKWLAALDAAVRGELDRVSQTLTGRIRQLAERYADPLPTLEREADALAAKVAAHLKKMGFAP